MEDKIRKIMDESTDYQTGEVDAEIAISKLLDLFSVSGSYIKRPEEICVDEWWCTKCGCVVPNEEVSYNEFHDIEECGGKCV